MTPDEKSGTLAGISVIDFTTAMAGPYCTQLLGDLGADIIKIERPDGGDMARGWGPPFVGEQSAYFLGANRNKRSITLNLAEPRGREILDRMLAAGDVLVHNVPRRETRDKLGIGAERCRKLNSKLIWAAISGFGNSGPYAGRPGYDIIAQGMAGGMAVTGEPDGPPMRFPTPMADITAGIYSAFAITAALFKRTQTGQGEIIDTALLDSQVTWLSNLASNYLAGGVAAKRLGNSHPSIVPYQPFPTADRWIIVAVGSERLWTRFVEVITMPELSQDERFRTNADRLANRDELVETLAARFKQKSSDEWLTALAEAEIPAGPILSPQDALSNEQLLARGMVVEFDHPATGLFRVLGNPMHLKQSPISYRLPPPLLGEHTTEILHELGYGDAEISELKTSNVI